MSPATKNVFVQELTVLAARRRINDIVDSFMFCEKRIRLWPGTYHIELFGKRLDNTKVSIFKLTLSLYRCSPPPPILITWESLAVVVDCSSNGLARPGKYHALTEYRREVVTLCCCVSCGE